MHLIALGHKVILITHQYGNRQGVRYLTSGLKVYYLPHFLVWDQVSFPTVRETVAFSSMCHEAILHARTLGLKAIFTDHSLFGFEDLSSILTNKLLKFTLSDINHVICVSHTSRENTVLRASLNPYHVSVIPNSIVSADFQPDTNKRNKNFITIVVTSRLVYRKGIDLLIDVIPRVCKNFDNVRFFIVGDGPKMVDLQQMREYYVLQDKVKLFGSVQNNKIRDILVEGDIFLNTSLTEAFCIAIIEAASCGLLVVSTKVGGIPEVLPSDMIIFSDPDGISILEALKNAIQILNCGDIDSEHNHTRVKLMYSWDNVALRTAQVYKNVIDMPDISIADRFFLFYTTGSWAGKLSVLIVAFNYIILKLLEIFFPVDEIELSLDFKIDQVKKIFRLNMSNNPNLGNLMSSKNFSSYDKLCASYAQNSDIPLLQRAYLDWKTEVIIKEEDLFVSRVYKSYVRLNFSHGTHEYHGSVIKNVRESFLHQKGRPVAIALDTKGPEIRTGMMLNDGFAFKTGHKLIFTTEEKYKDNGNPEKVYIDYKNLTKVMSPGKFIYVDDGTLTFKVVKVNEDNVEVESMNSGTFLSKKGVNLPGTNVDLPAVSEKDKLDLKFAVEHGVDMIFASFIRQAEDIHTIRLLLGEAGRNGSIKIISKIENHQGLDNFDEILKASDGIMVARGDLGTEIPSWKVFIAQKSMIAKCNIAGKPVICATQMQSMTSCPKPTRAEASDVANAVLDGADCVMLSYFQSKIIIKITNLKFFTVRAETASGQYPLESVSTMARICLEAEAVNTYYPHFNEIRSLTPKPLFTSETIAVATVNASLEEEAKVIVVLSQSGTTARLIAKYRPKAAIVVVTRDATVARQSHLFRGTYPMVYKEKQNIDTDELPPSPVIGAMHWKAAADWQIDVDARIDFGITEAKKLGVICGGETFIAVQGWKPGSGQTNCLRILMTPN
ncbi:Pyruvate kinase [Clydaea vesicula]|uniref:Pyruvate kinase n=1 Tax=Clydaea vesicula TaxID=447962 RepID=A0AAD5U5X4_9FUNG|nr:Pyruvate kinase [Clydaea vesicula]